MDPLIAEVRSLFTDDRVNIEDMEKALLSYKSNPRDWSDFAHFDERKWVIFLILITTYIYS